MLSTVILDYLPFVSAEDLSAAIGKFQLGEAVDETLRRNRIAKIERRGIRSDRGGTVDRAVVLSDLFSEPDKYLIERLSKASRRRPDLHPHRKKGVVSLRCWHRASGHIRVSLIRSRI
ncbi:hypothetical protein [Novosphingopyxis iocasae]|uniref:hypothetical protein n=1 Tax=Novosphingopyxis iocasae TaxID=2762729 RepID=UPI0016512114|nr:hypothetical protein [Novosphingopyxis iocasae]